MEQQKQQRDGDGGAAEADIERLPADLLAHVLSLLPTFRDLSMYGKANSIASYDRRIPAARLLG